LSESVQGAAQEAVLWPRDHGFSPHGGNAVARSAKRIVMGRSARRLSNRLGPGFRVERITVRGVRGNQALGSTCVYTQRMANTVEVSIPACSLNLYTSS
jgi:hypothetical protein